MTRACLLVHQYAYRHARVQRFAECLADAGIQTDLLCLRDPDQPEGTLMRGVRIFTIPLSRKTRAHGGQLLEYLLALVLFGFRLSVLHLKNHYDIVQVHNMPDFLVFAALIPRLLGARLVLDICDPMPEFYESRSAQGTKAGRAHATAASARLVRLLQAEERLSTAFVHAVICANANFKRCLVTRGVPAGKVTVVNYVPDETLFDRQRYPRKANNADQSFTVIYPGTIAPRYGLEVAVRALPQLREWIPHLRLLIIGPRTEHAEELETLAADLGVADLFELRPLVPLNSMASILSRADIGIYTALPDPHMSIAVPLKVLEYVAMGMPVVASRLPVLEHLFDESAIMFFEPGNVGAFAGCLRELYQSPAKRMELVQLADAAVLRRHPWSEERRAYFALLEKLLGGAPA